MSDRMDLDSMKYADLRSLAKELGLKANMKTDKLLKAIKQHYQKGKENQGQDDDDGVPEDENVAQGKDESPKEGACSMTMFVSTRRGKGNGTKRKITEASAVNESEGKTSPKAADVSQVDVEGSNEPCNASTAKKRKVSSDKYSKDSSQQTTGDEQHPHVKDEAPAPVETEKLPKLVKSGKIPRYQGLQQKRMALKPTTPNFKKLHEAQFNKMESIDSYVQRKTKQKESLKELKEPSGKMNQQTDGKPQVKKSSARATLFTPPPATKKLTEEKRRHTLLSASKAAPAGKDGPFRPSVLSTRRINVQFAEATRDNEFKRSLVKTPARMSLPATSSTPQQRPAGAGKPHGVKTSTFSSQKTPVPFVFSANTSNSATPGTQKKPSFDLKASLSRPLTWRPHKGKLKPFEETQGNMSGNKSQISKTHQETYKQHKVQSRNERRVKQKEGRKQKKENLLGARRGLVMM